MFLTKRQRGKLYQQCLTLTQPCCQARVALELKYLLTSLSIITSMYHRIIEACQEI